MSRAISWFAANHVAANLMMVLLIAGGLLTLPNIKQEVFPEISLPIITVSVDYPGASPAEVEAAVCVRVEEVLQGLQGIKRLHASANEGRGSVSVELLAGEDARVRMDEIRSRVDGNWIRMSRAANSPWLSRPKLARWPSSSMLTSSAWVGL